MIREGLVGFLPDKRNALVIVFIALAVALTFAMLQ